MTGVHLITWSPAMNAPELHPISSDAEQQMRETLALQRDSYIAVYCSLASSVGYMRATTSLAIDTASSSLCSGSIT